MANLDRPRGAEPKGKPLRENAYVAGEAIYRGDLLKKANTGKVVRAAASDALIGVAAASAAADEKVLVWDHPDQQFVMQADGGDIDAQTDILLNYDFVVASPDTTYSISRTEVDSSTGDTTATLPLKLLAVDERPDNALGAQVDCIVKINNHQLASGTGTAGV